jgi:hypothetical protein
MAETSEPQAGEASSDISGETAVTRQSATGGRNGSAVVVAVTSGPVAKLPL